MKQLDIFGNEIDVAKLNEELSKAVIIRPTIKGKFRIIYGYDEINKCKDCVFHECLHYNNKNYHKCSKMGFSNSKAIDIRLNDYACKLFKRKEVENNENRK